MRIWYILILACTVLNPPSAVGRELALDTKGIEYRNCLTKYENGTLSLVHSYDYEEMEQLKRLQALGYMEGSTHLVAQLLIPCEFSSPEATIKMTISSLSKYPGEQQYVVIGLVDESGRMLDREQILSGDFMAKGKGVLSAKVKTWGRNKGIIAFKFAGIKHVKISKIEVE